MHAPAALNAAFLVPAVRLLNAMIMHPDARDEDNENCTENAISTIGKILQFAPLPDIEPEKQMQGWLSCLPLTVDEMEAHVRRALASLASVCSSDHFPSVLFSGATQGCASFWQSSTLSSWPACPRW